MFLPVFDIPHRKFIMGDQPALKKYLNDNSHLDVFTIPKPVEPTRRPGLTTLREIPATTEAGEGGEDPNMIYVYKTNINPTFITQIRPFKYEGRYYPYLFEVHLSEYTYREITVYADSYDALIKQIKGTKVPSNFAR